MTPDYSLWNLFIKRYLIVTRHTKCTTVADLKTTSSLCHFIYITIILFNPQENYLGFPFLW